MARSNKNPALVLRAQGEADTTCDVKPSPQPASPINQDCLAAEFSRGFTGRQRLVAPLPQSRLSTAADCFPARYLPAGYLPARGSFFSVMTGHVLASSALSAV